MANWQPLTTIYLCRDTGVDERNKPYFESNEAMANFFQTKIAKTCLNCSYQRADERQYTTVECEYSIAISCDYIIFQNAGESNKWYICGITGVEWVNPNTCRIFFEVDAYCTFCGDIEWQPCFVEREHVEDDWNGSNPNFSSMGVSEDISCSPDTVVNDMEKHYVPDRYVVLSPYALLVGTDEIQLGGTVQYNVFQGLNSAVFSDASALNSAINALAQSDSATINNIVGIYSVPHQFIDGLDETIDFQAPWAVLGTKYNNAKCYSSQFCVIEISSLLTNSVTYKPELFTSSNEFHFKELGYYVAGNSGLLINPVNYANSDYVKEFGICINDTPQGSWVGNAFAEWNATKGLSTFIGGLTNTLGGAIGGMTMGAAMATPGFGAVMGILGGLSAFANYDSKLKEASKSGAVVGGKTNTTANGAVAFDAYGYTIRNMICNEPFMKSVDAYFDRFGYKVNLLKIPNVNVRPHWNYVKTLEAHVGGTIPKMYREQIEGLLNNGVTFWNTGLGDIGDYSNPAGNKG